MYLCAQHYYTIMDKDYIIFQEIRKTRQPPRRESGRVCTEGTNGTSGRGACGVLSAVDHLGCGRLDEQSGRSSERLALRQQEVAAAERAYEVSKDVMQNSSSTYLEVLTAQQSLLQSLLSLTIDRFDLVQGKINLFKALGGENIRKR